MLHSELLGWGVQIFGSRAVRFGRRKRQSDILQMKYLIEYQFSRGGGGGRAVDELVMLGQNCLPSNYHTHIPCR